MLMEDDRGVGASLLALPQALMVALWLTTLGTTPRGGISAGSRSASSQCWPSPQALVVALYMITSCNMPCC